MDRMTDGSGRKRLRGCCEPDQPAGYGLPQKALVTSPEHLAPGEVGLMPEPVEPVADEDKAAVCLLRQAATLVRWPEVPTRQLDKCRAPRFDPVGPIALRRKNALFAGSDDGARRWAIVASLVVAAKLNGVEPQAWPISALERIISGRTKAYDLDRLLPWS